MRPGNADVQLGVTQAEKQGLGAPLPPEQRTVEIFGAHAEIRAYDNPVYTRTVTTRPVTFTCAVCARTLTQQRFPGPLPRYCGAGCGLAHMTGCCWRNHGGVSRGRDWSDWHQAR